MAYRKTAKDARSVAFNKIAVEEISSHALDVASWEAKTAYIFYNMPPDMLPKDARAIRFADLAEILKESPDGLARLEGIERGSAGLESHRMTGSEYEQSERDPGAAFSFCLEGWTFTAFEDPMDHYRSSLGLFVAREGNFCAVGFEPVALLPRLREAPRPWKDDSDGENDKLWALGENAEGHADLFELVEPSTGRVALSVGTARNDGYYPSFVGYHDPELLALASAAGPIPTASRRKLRL